MPGSHDDSSDGATWSATTVATDAIGPDGELDPDASEGIEAILGFELPPPVERARRSKVNMATAGLAALVLVAGAFYAGVSVEKSHAKSSTTGNLAAAFSRFAAGRTGGTGAAGARGTGTGAAAAGGGAAGAGVTVGSVKLVDGKNVYVTDTSGAITKVVVGSAATVTVSQSGTVADLKPGDTVIVRGAAGKDGTINATSLSDSGAAGAGAGLGGFGGFGGAGAGGAAGGAGG